LPFADNETKADIEEARKAWKRQKNNPDLHNIICEGEYENMRGQT